MAEGPFKSAFDADTNGVVRREIVTYRMKNGMMVKESAVQCVIITQVAIIMTAKVQHH